MFCERAVNLLPPWACPTECQSHFSSLASPFSQDCCCGELIGPHSARAGCRRTCPTEISSAVSPFSSDLPVTAPSSVSVQLPSEVVTGHHHDSRDNDTTSMVHYPQWVSWSGPPSIHHSPLLHCFRHLWLRPVQHGAHSEWQPPGAFIPPAEFNHSLPLSLRLPHLQSYSEFNEDGK